ncbi:hypothetical protein Desde_3166 [Desulfitobacterium dehalogenans ATCC 51507]|uniref:Uncharacterized protein n=2 Tax=Desulfitobacterium dehalogenans TaxID=36854 RepID=I4ABX2_DESDJ|nr:hypothetical protein Desde_3166 [Desulfitobacterium dehalogenans ATCC 51507]
MLNFQVSSISGNYSTSKGTITVTAAPVVPVQSILEGVTIFGKTGTMPNMATRNPNGVGVGRSQAKEFWTGGGSTIFVKPQMGFYDGNDTWAYVSVPNLSPSNIKKGVDILGVKGEMSAGYEIGDRVLLSNLGMTPETKTLNTNFYSNNGSPFWANFINGVGIASHNFGNGNNALFSSTGRTKGLSYMSNPRIYYPITYGSYYYAIVVSANSSTWPDKWFHSIYKVNADLSEVRLDLDFPTTGSFNPSFLIAGEDGYLYVGYNGGSTIKKIDPNAFSVVATINLSLAPGNNAKYNAYVDASGNIYLSEILIPHYTDSSSQPRTNIYKYNQGGNLISSYIGSTTVRVPHYTWTNYGNNIAMSGKAGYLYIVNSNFDLVKINGSTMQPVWTYPLINFWSSGSSYTDITYGANLSVAPDGFITVNYYSYTSMRVFVLTPDKEVYYQTALTSATTNVIYDGLNSLFWLEYPQDGWGNYDKIFKTQRISTTITG